MGNNAKQYVWPRLRQGGGGHGGGWPSQRRATGRPLPRLDNHGGNGGDNDEDNDKWGRGA